MKEKPSQDICGDKEHQLPQPITAYDEFELHESLKRQQETDPILHESLKKRISIVSGTKDLP